MCCIETDMNKKMYENPFAIAAMLSYAFPPSLYHFNLSIFLFIYGKYKQVQISVFLVVGMVCLNWIRFGKIPKLMPCHFIMVYNQFSNTKIQWKAIGYDGISICTYFCSFVAYTFFDVSFRWRGSGTHLYVDIFHIIILFAANIYGFFQSNIKRKLTTHKIEYGS